MFSYVACCVPEIGADARVDDGDVEEKSLILEARVVVEECPCLRCDVCMYVCMYVRILYVCMYVCVYVCMYVCMYVFIKLHITTQSGPVILVILCHSH